MVCSRLRLEASANGIQPVGSGTGYMLSCPSGVVECQSDWDRDEVDIGNVGEQLGVVVGEFAKAPHDVDVGV